MGDSPGQNNVPKGQRDNSQYPGVSPDCRARSIENVEDFADCTTVTTDYCPHALYLGTRTLCRHPRVREIAELTSKLKTRKVKAQKSQPL